MIQMPVYSYSSSSSWKYTWESGMHLVVVEMAQYWVGLVAAADVDLYFVVDSIAIVFDAMMSFYIDDYYWYW